MNIQTPTTQQIKHLIKFGLPIEYINSLTFSEAVDVIYLSMQIGANYTIKGEN